MIVLGKSRGPIVASLAMMSLMVPQTSSADTDPRQPVNDVDSVTTHSALTDSIHRIDEVVVTTQKRSQSTMEVPLAVSAVKGTSLKDLGIFQMDDMAALAPGIQVQMQSPNNPSYVIRGVTDDDGSATSQPRVSVFVDGVSTSRSRGSATELYDVERVEVAKGPQGTLFGRGAETGGISIIRNKAKDNLSGELMARYGAYNTRQLTGFINTPIISGKLANRFVFDYDAHEGFIKNIAGGRLNGKSAVAFRNSTAWWNGGTSVNFIVDYQHDSYPGTSFKTRFPQFGNPDSNSPANLEEGKGLYIHRDVGGGTLLVDHNFFNGWKLSSITGLRAFYSNEKFDADGTYLPLLNCEEKARSTQFSQELRMGYDNNRRLSGFAGLSYFYENTFEDVAAHTDMQYLYPVLFSRQLKARFSSLIDKVKPLIMAKVPTAMQPAVDQQITAMMSKWFPESTSFDPQSTTPDIYGDLKKALGAMSMDLDQALGAMGENGQKILATLKGISDKPLSTDYSEEGKNSSVNHAVEFFADGSYKIYKGLTLTVGLRGSYEHQKSGYSSVTDQSIFGPVLFHPTVNGEKVTASKNYWSWVGRAALNWLIKNSNIYISASRGRRPGVIYFNNDPEDLSTLKPEIIYSYEAGVKGRIFGGHMNYDLCAYYYDWYHFQVNRFDQIQSKYVADDAGRAHSFGVEASLAWSPVREFTLFGNYSYIDGKFNEKDEDGNKQEYAGNRFRLTPKNSFTIGAYLDFPVGSNSNIFFRPTYTYKSKVFFEEDNNPDFTQDGYGLCNFTLGWRYQPKKVYYEISAFGKNIFDEKYIIDAGNSGRQIGFPTYVGGSRSVIGAQFKIGF